MPPVTRSHQPSHQSSESEHIRHDPNLGPLLNAAAAEEERTSGLNENREEAGTSRPNANREEDTSFLDWHTEMASDELPALPKSWETVTQCAIKDFQKATENYHRSQALVDKLIALQEDDKVIQSLMVKVPGLESSDPESTPVLRAGLQDITIKFRKECHAHYIQHEQMIVERNKSKLPLIKESFASKIKELAEPYANAEFTSLAGAVSGAALAHRWANLAASSFNRQINQFQSELIERKASREAARSARTEAREEANRQADDIPREEAISALVQKEVSKTEQRLSAAIKPLQEQLAQLLKLQNPAANNTAPGGPAAARKNAPARQTNQQPTQSKNEPGRRRNKRGRQNRNPNQNTSSAGGPSVSNPNQRSQNTGLDPEAAPFVPRQPNAQPNRRRQPGPRPQQQPSRPQQQPPPPPPPPSGRGKAPM